MERVFFCPFCASKRVIEECEKKGYVRCHMCGKEQSMAELSKIISQHVDVLHLPRSLLLEQLMGQQQENVKMKEEVIKEDCPKCKHPEMSYHTKQLRGLDEGQTIFYTCLNPKCGHNYTVNS